MTRKPCVLMQTGPRAELYIYGDITDNHLMDSDVTNYDVVQRLQEMDANEIHVYINSYGGSVSAGLAIYNALKRHPAQVVTYCDGMACSIASVIFMAGDIRIMNKASLLMIHNAWTYAEGNAEELRKQADDLEKITSASIAAYMTHVNLSKPKLKALMDAETWLTPKEALRYGFASQIEAVETGAPSQSAKKRIFERLLQTMQADDDPEESQDMQQEEQEQEEQAAEPQQVDGEDEEPEAPDEPDDEEEPEEEKQEKDQEPAQEWRGFFYALLGESKY